MEGDYSGQVTTQQGQTWNLNHQHSRTDEGWQRQGSTPVQDAEGQTVGSSLGLLEGQAGQGWQRSGQFSNSRSQPYSTESSSPPTGLGRWQRETHVFNAEGDLLGGPEGDVQLCASARLGENSRGQYLQGVIHLPRRHSQP